MFPSYASRSFISAMLVLLLLNVLFFFFVTDFDNLVVEMGEAGLLENLQLVYLGLAAIAFFIGGLRSEGPARMFAIGMSVLMWIFFFREFEIEPTGPVSNYIKSHAFRWHEAIIVIAFAAIYVFRHSDYVRPVLTFVFSRKAWPFYLAAALIALGEVFEKMHGLAFNEFLEEALESLSYFTLLCLGVRSITAPQQAPRSATA
ncbi:MULTISPECIES: hypothetical protein [Pseudochrobactrum]|uniref:Uncharacterized protein n=2 Tax=Pseudochrobactrum TaxID=354349 RepID=A0A7W8AP19_9HYPH|nr:MULTISPECIES: hypothetical protein [Pseudochrobactrum]KAB0539944.1 hypothetical protein F7P81_00610 [Pseudochrobactrum saccharolyticum]MBB5092693.1 hypothetical protein [Pseudochrobactrum saccharolyticum]MDP8251297.1 hypothetical protein [Pseudochrobactrum saccharolyticum]UCA46551.1 hypothetical protein LDL70_04735 [Pseudochrobactrum sp. XF203]